MFEIWKGKMNKQYDATESDYRFQVWLQNLHYVKTHNARFAAGLETYDLEMNHFADLTNE